MRRDAPTRQQYLYDMSRLESAGAYDRVMERRRAVALARHFREAEGLSIAQIADRLGRSSATVKAYFYDPSDANKRPADSTQERQCWALAGHARTSICKPLLDSSLRRPEAGVPHCPICPPAAV